MTEAAGTQHNPIKGHVPINPRFGAKFRKKKLRYI